MSQEIFRTYQDQIAKLNSQLVACQARRAEIFNKAQAAQAAALTAQAEVARLEAELRAAKAIVADLESRLEI